MTDVTDSSCSRYPSTSSVPVIGIFCNFLFMLNEFSIGKNVDLCMTNVDDATCASSYGTLLTSTPAGTGIVGYIQQLSKTTDANANRKQSINEDRKIFRETLHYLLQENNQFTEC